MRVYLDTNILAFLVGQDCGHSISGDVMSFIQNYEVTLFSSSVCFQELTHLIQIGKLRLPHIKDTEKAAQEALRILNNYGITLSPITEKHIHALAKLPLYDDHRDPNDRLIIAQAISDRIPLISSDRKFIKYESCGLEFIFNER